MRVRIGLRSITSIVAGLVLSASAGAATIYPANNGFEIPNVGANGYAYANQAAGTSNQNFSSTLSTAVTGWAFVGPGAGVAANGSAFNTTGATNGNNDGPGGSISTTSAGGQAAFLQGGNGTLADIGGNSAVYASQNFTVAAGETATSINFASENRQSQGNQINVYVDGALVTPVSLLSTSGIFGAQSVLVSLPAGTHTLAIAGNNVPGGDQTVFVDDVSITTVPEPTSLGLLGLASIGLLARRRQA